MTDTDQNNEDEVLKRMLKTPPKPHESKTHRGIVDKKSRRDSKNHDGSR